MIWNCHRACTLSTHVHNDRLVRYFKGSETVFAHFPNISTAGYVGITVVPVSGWLALLLPFHLHLMEPESHAKHAEMFMERRLRRRDIILVIYASRRVCTCSTNRPEISFGLCILVAKRLLSFAASLRNRVSLDARPGCLRVREITLAWNPSWNIIWSWGVVMLYLDHRHLRISAKFEK